METIKNRHSLLFSHFRPIRYGLLRLDHSKDGLLIAGAALQPGPDAPRRFQLFKDKLERYGLHLGRTVHREGAYLLRPETIPQLQTGHENLPWLVRPFP